MADIRLTGLLDDFNRADENPLSGGGNWAQVDSTTFPNQMRNLSNLAAGQAFLTISASYWTPGTFTGDMEVWGQCAGSTDNNEGWILGLFHDVGGAGVVDGYRAGWFQSVGPDTLQIRRIDNGSTTLISTTNAEIPVGDDVILFRTVGGDLEMWLSTDDGANWTNQVTHADSTYRTDLRLAIATSAAGEGFDPKFLGFGGGVEQEEEFIPQMYRRVPGSF